MKKIYFVVCAFVLFAFSGFAFADQTLTLHKVGSGNSSIGTMDPGVFCGANCTDTSVSFPDGTSIFLVVKFSVNSVFRGWSGDCGGTSPICQITMDRARTVTALIESRYDLVACPMNSSTKDFLQISPIELSQIDHIEPLGHVNTNGGHIFPVAHLYFALIPSSSPPPAPVTIVQAPADAVITNVIHSTNGSQENYEITLQTCRDFMIHFDHITSVPDEILSRLGAPSGCLPDNSFCMYYGLHVPVRVGQMLGFAGVASTNLDFEAYDLRASSLFYANPTRVDPGFLHVVCPLDYFTDADPDSTKTSLYAKLVSTAGGSCGHVAQDMSGKMQGAWYLFGSHMSFDESNILSLIHDSDVPAQAKFVTGSNLAGASILPRGEYFYTAAGSGNANPDFSAAGTASVPAIYCFDGLYQPSTIANTIILAQMPNASTLLLKVVTRSSPSLDCSVALSEGIWNTGTSPGLLTTDSVGTVVQYNR